jgi:hypothetical protein
MRAKARRSRRAFFVDALSATVTTDMHAHGDPGSCASGMQVAACSYPAVVTFGDAPMKTGGTVRGCREGLKGAMQW